MLALGPEKAAAAVAAAAVMIISQRAAGLDLVPATASFTAVVTCCTTERIFR